jgi:hypothetical protein
MSGANGIEKRLPCDREERIHLKELYPRFFSRFPNPGAAPLNELINPLNGNPDPTRIRYPLLSQTVPVGTLDAQQAMNDILLTSASSAAITGPTAAQITTLLGQLFLTSVGNGLLGANPNNERDGYIINVENNDTVAKVITFGAGVTPATLTVLPGTISQVAVEVFTNNPPAVRVYVLSSATTSATAPPPGFGTVLTANQAAVAATTTILFDSVAGPNYAGLTYVPGTGIWTVPVTGFYNLSTFGGVIVAGATGQVAVLDSTTGVNVMETTPIEISATPVLFSLVRTGIFLTAGDTLQVQLVPGAGTMTLQGSASPNFINGFSATLAQAA